METQSYTVAAGSQPGLWVVRDVWGRRVGIPYHSQRAAECAARALERKVPERRGPALEVCPWRVE